nr:TnsA endonuclease C-terminal domain-containing protein [Moritella viscosa]SHO18105.1 Transposon Tn7 transposition protein tnsA [Moritella viscosa]
MDGLFFMSKNRYFNSEAKNAKWIKQGRGSGHGINYLPWLTVRDLPSRGRSCRVFGHKSARTHHLLSDLELAVFLILEWDQSVTDIREQFPLNLKDTQSIARNAQIKHPVDRGVQQIMSSDFLVNTNFLNKPKFALQAKYADDLEDPRTIEKLEIERQFWKLKSIPWFILTENDIPKVVFENIKWLYPAQQDEIDLDVFIERINFYQHIFKSHQTKTIITLSKLLDSTYNLELGETLLELRQLLAHRCFEFDINIPIKKLKISELHLANYDAIREAECLELTK